MFRRIFEKYFFGILKGYITFENVLYLFGLAKDNIDASRFIKDNIEAIEIIFKCIFKVAALVFSLFLFLLEWVIIFISKL